MIHKKYIYFILATGLLFCVSIIINANNNIEGFSEFQKITKKLTHGKNFYSIYFADGKILNKKEVMSVKFRSAERWFKRVVKEKWLANIKTSNFYAKRIQLNKVKYKTITGKLTKYESDEKIAKDISVRL